MLMDEESGALSSGANVAPASNDSDKVALPITSQVKPLKELLDGVRELEEKQQNIPSAVPLMDQEEVNKQQKLQWCRQWIFVGTSVLVVLCIVGLVLGITLGWDKTAANTVPQSPTPSPATQEFVSLKSLIKSVSLDGGAALEVSSLPQSKALAWLAGNKNLEEYPDWQRIQHYVLVVFYYSTNRDEWADNTGWLLNGDECLWHPIF